MLFDSGSELYRGYVDDERNTDHAWIETILRSYHCPTELAGILDFKRDYGDNENMMLNWEVQRHYEKVKRNKPPSLARGESMEAPETRSTKKPERLEHVRWLDLSRIAEIGGGGLGARRSCWNASHVRFVHGAVQTVLKKVNEPGLLGAVVGFGRSQLVERTARAKAA